MVPKGRYKPFKSKNGFFVLGQIRALHHDMKINISNQTKNFNQKKKGKLGDQSRKLNLESFLEHTSCTLRIKLKDESKTFKQMKCPKNTCSFFFCHVSEFDLH